MGDISDVVKGAGNIVQGAISQTVSGLISNAFAKRAEKRAFKRTKELMALEDEYQRNLAEDQMSIRKLALQKAGYSTADPEGAGTTVPTSNASGSSVPSIAPDYSALGSNISLMAQARLINTQATAQEIENKYLAKKLQGEIDLLNINIKTAQEMLQPRLDEISAHIDQMVSASKLTIDQSKQVRQNIDNLKAALDGIHLDNKFKEYMNPKLIEKTKVEIDNMLKDGRVKEAEAKLADMGIIVSADMLTNLASISLTDKTGEITDKLVHTAKEVFKSAPAAAQELLDSALDTAVDNASSLGRRVVKGLKKAVKFPIEFGKGLHKEIWPYIWKN